jgi:SAM-dependent methyltransferase
VKPELQATPNNSSWSFCEEVLSNVAGLFYLLKIIFNNFAMMNDRNVKNSEWYAKWFDTSYYHLLYQNRNEEEAEFFLSKIQKKIGINPGSKVWDMACGKGRHVNHLSKLGIRACGTDLSKNSILLAQENFKNENSEFLVHDMRSPFRINYFDVVLNVFTSMGYFERRRDDERVFISAAQSLKQGGYFVVDFLNAQKVIENLRSEETKTIGNIRFEIKREVQNDCIIKSILVLDEDKKLEFAERVRAYKLEDFESLAAIAGLKHTEVLGNYALDSFVEKSSDRLILIFKKN